MSTVDNVDYFNFSASDARNISDKASLTKIFDEVKNLIDKIIIESGNGKHSLAATYDKTTYSYSAVDMIKTNMVKRGFRVESEDFLGEISLNFYW